MGALSLSGILSVSCEADATAQIMWHLKEKCFNGTSHKTPLSMELKIKNRQGGAGWGWGMGEEGGGFSLC